MDSRKKTVFAQALFEMFGINRLGTVRGDEVEVLSSYLDSCKAFPDAGLDSLTKAFGEILGADAEVANAVIDDFTKFVENRRFLKRVRYLLLLILSTFKIYLCAPYLVTLIKG